ncbi:MAG: RDD family protein [Mycobacteriaceae bacterium]|nr:RDD family protein [Mycobacteriaceae bacterium]
MTEQPPQPPSSSPPPQQGGYPPPPQQGGYQPPPQQGGYPPPPQQGGYPPQASGYQPTSQAGAPGQPVGQMPPEAYTPWLHRVGAYIIDIIPILIVGGIGQGILFATGENSCVTDSYGYGVYCTSSPSGIGLAVAFIAWLASLAYAIWNLGYRQGTTGSSIGKSVLKFKVVSEKTGQPIGFGMSIIRQIAHVVDAIICYIGFLFPLWDSKRQTLADKIMTTVCLPLNPQPLPSGRPPQ